MFGMLPFENRNDNFFDTFDNFQRKFFSDSGANLPAFRTDIRDAGDRFVLESELPGFKKEDIHLHLDGDTLTIQAERHSDHEDDDKKGKFVRCERSYGSYSRSFDVSGIRTDGITASYEGGVLELKLPKQTVEVSTARQIDIQ